MIAEDGSTTYSDMVAIEATSALEAVTFYPNPTRGQLTVRTQSSADGLQMLTVVDVTGKLLLSRSVDVPTGTYEQSIDLSAYPAGVYFVQLGDVVERVVVE